MQGSKRRIWLLGLTVIGGLLIFGVVMVAMTGPGCDTSMMNIVSSL